MARKQYSAEFKAKIALEAIRGLKTVNEIATESGLHPSQIALWKKQAVEALPDTFSTRRQQQDKGQAELTGELYQQIGQLKVELDWLKKKAGLASGR
jgi:transposase-like protein